MTSRPSRSRTALRVLGPIESMEWLGPARVGVDRRRGIERALDTPHESVVRGAVGTWHAGRWHQARAQLADNRLPGLRVATDTRDIQCLERRRHRAAAPLGIGVTGQAVAGENLLVGGKRRGHRGHRPGALRRLHPIRGRPQGQDTRDRQDRQRANQTTT